MKNSLETRLGIFVALAVVAAVILIETIGGTEFFHPGYHVSALFNSAQDLKLGNNVKMAGVEIGRVEKISLADNKVRVTMKIHSDAFVKTDSKAAIKFTGLMGQNFVAVQFGSADAPKAIDGTVLETEEQPDLNAIMVKLDNAAAGIQNLTKSFTGDTINNLLGPMTDLIKQNSGHITAAISNLESISGQIASGQGTVGKLIYEDTLYASANTTVSNVQHVVDTITSGQGTIGKLV